MPRFQVTRHGGRSGESLSRRQSSPCSGSTCRHESMLQIPEALLQAWLPLPHTWMWLSRQTGLFASNLPSNQYNEHNQMCANGTHLDVVEQARLQPRTRAELEKSKWAGSSKTQVRVPHRHRWPPSKPSKRRAAAERKPRGRQRCRGSGGLKPKAGWAKDDFMPPALTEDSVLDCVFSVLSTLNWTCTWRAKRGLCCTFLGSAAPAQRGGNRAGSTHAQASNGPRTAHLLRVLGPDVGHHALHQAHKHPLRDGGMGRCTRPGQAVCSSRSAAAQAAANMLRHWGHRVRHALATSMALLLAGSAAGASGQATNTQTTRRGCPAGQATNTHTTSQPWERTLATSASSRPHSAFFALTCGGLNCRIKGSSEASTQPGSGSAQRSAVQQQTLKRAQSRKAVFDKCAPRRSRRPP